MGPISYSQAKLYETCPARYKAERIDKMERIRPHALRVGVFMHNLLESYFNILIGNNSKSDYDAMERAFEDHWHVNGPKDFVESDYQELRDLMIKTREGVVLENPKELVGAEIAIAVDRKWKKVDWNDPAAFLRMRLDRLDIDAAGRATVWDYKTGFKIESAEESKQLKLYAAAVWHLIPRATSFSGTLFYARQEKWRRADFKQSDLEEAERWIFGVADRMAKSEAAGDWPATPGAGCMDCPAFDGCEARQRAITDLPPRTREEAEDVLGRYAMVEREHKGLQEQLKLWIAVNGPVEAAGVLAELAADDRKEYPIDRLQTTLKAIGFELLNFAKADTDKIKKQGKKDPEFQRLVGAIAIDKSRSTFKLRRL